MKQKDKEEGKELVPEQKKGNKTGATDETVTETKEEAVELFRKAKERYLDINNWHKYSGPASATFFLVDEKGNKVSRSPQRGDYIKIDLPGPGPTSGDGYDYVVIEAIEDHTDAQADTESFSFRSRPAPKPGSNKDEIAHFYTDAASSTFLLVRKGNIVSAAEKGRNEVVNNKDVGVIDKIRNTAVGESARHGMAYPQWKTLMKGILGK